jgi:peptidoglycan hydrolase-like protein with peptidoglycan-binding domain
MKLRPIAIAISATFAAGAIAAGNQATSSQELPSRNIEERSKFSGPAATGAPAATQERQGAGAGASAPPLPARDIAERSKFSGMQPSPELVRQVQQELKEKGHDVGSVDGIYGPQTQQAVMEFQRAQGLPRSGRLDGETLSALGLDSQSAATGGTSGAGAGRSDNPPLPSRNIEEKSKY